MGNPVRICEVEPEVAEFGLEEVEYMLKRQPTTYALMTYCLMMGGGEIEYRRLGITRKAYRKAIENLSKISGFSIRKNFEKGEEGGHQGGQGRFAVSVDYERLPEFLKFKGGHQGGHHSHTGSRTRELNVPLKRVLKYPKKKSASLPLAENDFELFYYGPSLKVKKGEGVLKKTDVASARKAFAKMRKSCDIPAEELTRRYNAHYSARVDHTLKNPAQFVKHPASWLNAGSYEDEELIEATKPKANPLTDPSFLKWMDDNGYDVPAEALEQYYEIYTTR